METSAPSPHAHSCPASHLVEFPLPYFYNYSKIFFDKVKTRATKGSPRRKNVDPDRFECIKCGGKFLSKSGFYRHGVKCMIDITT